jgi:thioredoxin reductase/SAM-dependent methyltransferase
MAEHPPHHDHQPPSIERHCDVAVVGGSAAGLGAALQVARQRRSVIVVDAGDPRNGPAAHLHSYLGFDGQPPAALTGAGREEVRGYGVEVLPGRVERVTRDGEGRFHLELVGGVALVARRLLVATGLADELPPIDGLRERWGRDVIHCPFCHGYEVRDQRLVLVVTHAMGLHTAPLLRHLAGQLTVVLHDRSVADLLPTAELDQLRASGVAIVEQAVVRLLLERDGAVGGVELADGSRLDADAVVVGPRFRPRLEAFAELGLRVTAHPSGLGEVVEVDATGRTGVDGVFAAGNVTDPSQQLLAAAAHGALVGGMISFSLAHDDLRAAARPSANELDWDHRYGGEPLWSGRPNGSLVHEVAGRAPGRALDVGAGEGGDAIWLAEQGWRVTASDISGRALTRIGSEAERRGLSVDRLQADANAPAPFEAGAYDLVTAAYASIPRTPDGRGVANLLGAVAPGGTLLVIGHDLEPMRAPVDTATHSRAFDPDAYVRIDDVAAALASAPAWEVEVHEVRPRPGGTASSHHVDDVVLRARHTR